MPEQDKILEILFQQNGDLATIKEAIKDLPAIKETLVKVKQNGEYTNGKVAQAMLDINSTQNAIALLKSDTKDIQESLEGIQNPKIAISVIKKQWYRRAEVVGMGLWAIFIVILPTLLHGLSALLHKLFK